MLVLLEARSGLIAYHQAREAHSSPKGSAIKRVQHVLAKLRHNLVHTCWQCWAIVLSWFFSTAVQSLMYSGAYGSSKLRAGYYIHVIPTLCDWQIHLWGGFTTSNWNNEVKIALIVTLDVVLHVPQSLLRALLCAGHSSTEVADVVVQIAKIQVEPVRAALAGQQQK